MAKKNTTVQIVIIVVIVVAAILGMTMYWRKKKEDEGYANLSDLDNLGAIEPHYRIEDLGTPVPSCTRLDTRYPRALPPPSYNITPYNIDVADPQAHSYLLNPPRVLLKDPRMETSVFLAVNGDIPIRYSPNVPLIGTSRYGDDSWMGNGLFTEWFKNEYRRNTARDYRNMPMHVVNEELIMDA